jgi:2-isopropylmalate synthase
MLRVEGWDLEQMLKHAREAIEFSLSNGCPVMYVTEDTTRSDPKTLKILLSEAIEYGATRLCICDTVGHAMPNGVKDLIRYVREEIVGDKESEVKIDWHGHSDRGLALANTLAAIEAGVDRVHGTCLGIGERAGNTPMDLLLVNLKLLGIVKRDLTKLKEYCEKVAKYCGYPIPMNYPVVGRDAFRTGTGVHAAAIIKSIAKEEDRWLRDRVYSGVSAGDFGLQQVIEVGPMSGKSNVGYWLEERGLEPHPDLVDTIFERAKQANRLLTDGEIYKLIVEEFISKKLSQIPKWRNEYGNRNYAAH